MLHNLSYGHWCDRGACRKVENREIKSSSQLVEIGFSGMCLAECISDPHVYYKKC